MVVDPAQVTETEVAEPEAAEQTSPDGWQSLEPWIPAPPLTEPAAEPASQDAPEAVQDDEDDARPISRRNAREIAAEAVKAAEAEREARAEAEARANRLQAEQDARNREAQQIEAEALAWIGTDAEISELDQKIDALDGKAFGLGSVDEYGTLSDEAKQARAERVQLAAQKAEKLRARKFLEPLQNRVLWTHHQAFTAAAANVVGLDPIEFAKLTVDTPTSKATLRTHQDMVKFVVDHALEKERAKHAAELEDRDATIEALKKDRGSLRARAAGAGAVELETGGHGNGADLTLEAYERMSSAERLKLRRENPGAIDRMMARAMVR